MLDGRQLQIALPAGVRGEIEPAEGVEVISRAADVLTMRVTASECRFVVR